MKDNKNEINGENVSKDLLYKPTYVNLSLTVRKEIKQLVSRGHFKSLTSFLTIACRRYIDECRRIGYFEDVQYEK